MKINGVIIIMLLFALHASAKPGESYTLTGKEKGVSEIIKVDMKQYPELYKGESLNGYILKFKRENKIGQRKLSPGDKLHFPKTLASIKKEKANTETKGRYVEGKSSHLYAVIFELKVDMNGKLVNFGVSKVIDPQSGTTDAVSIDLPPVYLDSAKTHAQQHGYKAHVENGQPVDFYVFYFYDPTNPEIVITEIKK